VGYVPAAGDEKQAEDLQFLRDLGVKLVPVEPPNLKRDYGLPRNELQAGVVACESAAAFEDLTRRGEPKGVKGWPQYFLLGHFLTAVDYLKLNRIRAIVMQRFDKMMQAVDVYLSNDWNAAADSDDRWEWYGNQTGHPIVAFPKKFEERDGFQMPHPLMLIGRIYDESTLLALAHACQRSIGLMPRPPLDQFLKEKDEILAGEQFPDENKYYTD